MTYPFRIEVCGGMASGKTTFAKLFSDTVNLILEEFTSVPFWRAFFDSPGSYNFETELSFLLQHYHQIKRNADQRNGRGPVFCDFSFILDRAYASVSLDGGKCQAFAAVLQEALSEVGPPQLIVHLQCSAETELRRIQARGRLAEASVTLHFLDSLNRAVEAKMSDAQKSITTLLFDSDKEDFAFDPEVKDRCRNSVLATISELASVAPSHVRT
jgi:deoxyguanosine kinase